MTDSQIAAYYAGLIATTKKFGYCYAHSGMRGGIAFDGIRYHVAGFGRSLEGGGHKYKVTAHAA